MTRKSKDRKFAEGLYWLSAANAANQTGLTKSELFKRATTGEIRCTTEWNSARVWYSECDLDPLIAARRSLSVKEKPVKKRVKTIAQLEKEWANSSAKQSKQEPITRVPESRRGKKPMLWRMLAKPKGDE